MSTGVRAKFYQSKTWEKTAKAYKKYVGGLCERCYKKGIVEPGVIVHHKVYLNDRNLNNLDISLSFNNLELLCRQCHSDEHTEAQRKKKASPRRWIIDEYGAALIVDTVEDFSKDDEEESDED